VGGRGLGGAALAVPGPSVGNATGPSVSPLWTCGGGSGGGGSEGTIHVGTLFPTSGTVAAAGTDMLNGMS